MNKTRKFDYEVFKSFIASKGYSIRSLGAVCTINEKTMRLCAKTKTISIGSAIDICSVLKCSFTEAFGSDDSSDWVDCLEIIIHNERKRMNAVRKLDSDIFKSFISSKGYSVRSLAKECECTEQTIRRCVDSRTVTIGVGLDICNVLHCSFDQAFGPDDSNEWAHVMHVMFGFKEENNE